MSFPRYSKYKDSGVEWLGEVPEHWRVTRVKRVIEFQTGWTPPTGDDSSYGGQHSWANISDLRLRVINATETTITDSAIALSKLSLSPKGSLLFSFKLSIGQVSFAGRDLYTNEAIASFLPSAEVDLTFAYYAFPLFLVKNAAENIYGAKLLNQELIRNAALVLPHYEEQSMIACFLDRETAKIDALVEEQRRLIELLKEKRQAVISHAVTKGLDPNAPMKDSGIEWLGKVPTHWKVLQLGRVCIQVADGPHFSPNYVDDGIPFLSARNIKPGAWSFDDLKYISAEDCEVFDRRIIPRIGDVLYTKGGTTGVAHAVDLDFRFQVWVHIAVLRIKTEMVIPDYLAFALNSAGSYEQAQLFTRGATNNDLGLTRMIKIWLGLPSVPEQQAICELTKIKVSAIDRLISDTERAMQLIRERRSALISAAVTGKIDVRSDTKKDALPG